MYIIESTVMLLLWWFFYCRGDSTVKYQNCKRSVFDFEVEKAALLSARRTLNSGKFLSCFMQPFPQYGDVALKT